MNQGILIAGAGLVLIGIILYIGFQFIKKIRKEQERVVSEQEENVQEFMNIVDIRDKCIYTQDKKVFIGIRIESMDINLRSKREREILAKNLTTELSFINFPFKFLAVSRPVDISKVLAEYEEIKNSSVEHVQKRLLRYEIDALMNYAGQADVVERQFYIVLWANFKQGIENDLFKKGNDLIHRFNEVQIQADILEQTEILTMLNLVNNPHYAVLDEEFPDRIVPMLVETK